MRCVAAPTSTCVRGGARTRRTCRCATTGPTIPRAAASPRSFGTSGAVWMPVGGSSACSADVPRVLRRLRHVERYPLEAGARPQPEETRPRNGPFRSQESRAGQLPLRVTTRRPRARAPSWRENAYVRADVERRPSTPWLVARADVPQVAIPTCGASGGCPSGLPWVAVVADPDSLRWGHAREG